MLVFVLCIFFFKQKTAYEMRISDWSSDVCSSDLDLASRGQRSGADRAGPGTGVARTRPRGVAGAAAASTRAGAGSGRNAGARRQPAALPGPEVRPARHSATKIGRAHV